MLPTYGVAAAHQAWRTKFRQKGAGQRKAEKQREPRKQEELGFPFTASLPA